MDETGSNLFTPEKPKREKEEEKEEISTSPNDFFFQEFIICILLPQMLSNELEIFLRNFFFIIFLPCAGERVPSGEPYLRPRDREKLRGDE